MKPKLATVVVGWPVADLSFDLEGAPEEVSAAPHSCGALSRDVIAAMACTASLARNAANDAAP
jgi:hypothetical protein